MAGDSNKPQQAPEPPKPYTPPPSPPNSIQWIEREAPKPPETKG